VPHTVCEKCKAREEGEEHFTKGKKNSGQDNKSGEGTVLAQRKTAGQCHPERQRGRDACYQEKP